MTVELISFTENGGRLAAAEALGIFWGQPGSRSGRWPPIWWVRPRTPPW